MTPAVASANDPNAGRAGGQVHLRRRRLHHRHPVLQGAVATPARTSATSGPAPGRSWPRATFSGETASGWQQVNFATPVAIAANTTYVASYFAPAGGYAADDDYFATAGYDNAPLHALADGVSGGDGVYVYGSGETFPTGSYQSDQLLGRRRLHHRTQSSHPPERLRPHLGHRRRPVQRHRHGAERQQRHRHRLHRHGPLHQQRRPGGDCPPTTPSPPPTPGCTPSPA